MAENSGKCFLVREISIYINWNMYFQLSVDCQNVKKKVNHNLNEFMCGYLERLLRKCHKVRENEEDNFFFKNYFDLLIDGCWKTIGSLDKLLYLLSRHPRHSLKKIIHCSNTPYYDIHFPFNVSLVSTRLTGSLYHVIKTNGVIARICETNWLYV